MRNNLIPHFDVPPSASLEYMLSHAFFLLLPFVYFLQVLAGQPAAGLIGYAPLVLLLGVIAGRWEECRRQFAEHPKTLGLLVFGLVAHNAISGLGFLLTGGVGLGGRVLILFTLPFVLFVSGARLTSEQQWGIVKVVAFTAVIVAAELLWEDICVWRLQEPSWFQLLNYHYVLEQTGKSLTQLYLPEYRGAGLLEHVHVSTFFLAIGIMAGMAVYLKTGARRYLAAAAFCAVVLVAHGIRFAALAGGVAVVLNLLLTRGELEGVGKGRLRLAVLLFSLTVLAVLLLDPFGTVRRFYIPVVMRGAWNLDRPDDFTPASIISNGVGVAEATILSRLAEGLWSGDFYMGLLGHGIAQSLAGDVAGLDDDFFVVQIFSQYGILGGLLFYGIFVVAAMHGVRALRLVRQDDGLLLSFAMSMVFLLAVSTLHSGVIQRKVMFALLLWGLAVIYSFSGSFRQSTIRVTRVSSGSNF